MNAATIQLLLGFGLLIGCCASGLIVLRVMEREAQLKKRVAAVVNGPGKMRPINAPVSLVASDKANATLADVVSGFFGFSLHRLDHYPLKWWVALSICAVLGYVLSWIGAKLLGGVAFLAWPLLWWVLCRGFFSWCEGRRRDALFRQFPDALAMIVRSVRVGIPVTEAVRAVGRELQQPTAAEFARLADEAAIGMPFEEALFMMAERNNVSEYRFFATALALQAQTGGALSETLENLADVIRKRVSVRERGRALASEAKTSAAVLAALPPLAMLGLWALNPDYIGVLFYTPMGHKIFGLACIMLAGGIFAMRQIISRSLR